MSTVCEILTPKTGKYIVFQFKVIQSHRPWSSKVMDLGDNRKRTCDFLLVRHCDYGPILQFFAPLLRYGDLLAENCVHTPLSFGSPLPMFPLEFRGEVNYEETRVTGGEHDTSTVFD